MNLTNNNSRPLIFIGSNSHLCFFTDACELHGITVHGIIDSDYFGNTAELEGIPVLDTENVFDNPEKLDYYKNNFHFFLATNWVADSDAFATRNKHKRDRLIEIIEKYNLPCINLVDPTARVHKSVVLGKNIFIDAVCYIAPKSRIGDFTNLFTGAGIGYNNTIGRSCVFQRHSGTMNDNVIEDEVYFGLHAQDSKGGLHIRKGTVIHPCLMIRRDTQENEVISLVGKDLRKVYQLHQES